MAPHQVIGLIFLFKYEKQELREVVQFPPQGLFFAKQVSARTDIADLT